MDTIPQEAPASTEFNWLTIDGLIEFSENQITENQLRWLLRDREHNGLSEHVRVLGRKIYINRPGFIRWFEGQGGAK